MSRFNFAPVPENKYNQFRANWLAWQITMPTGYHQGVDYFKRELKQFSTEMQNIAHEHAAKIPQHFRFAQ